MSEITDEDVLEALARSGSVRGAAKDLGIARSTMRDRVDRLKMKGQFEVPAGNRVTGVSALVGADGEIKAQWIKTKAEVEPTDLAEALKEAFKDYSPHLPVREPPGYVNEDLITVYPCGDWHMGLYAWAGDTGTNWDLKTAERVIGDAMDQLITRSGKSANAVVLGGGDLLHSDSQENRTARSGNQLDVDGRYPKVLMAAARLMVRTIDTALVAHEHVTVRILKGNHDDHAAVAIAYFLLAWYRNEPRVLVEDDMSLFWWHRFGSVMFGSTHGHTVKLKDMPQIMAHRRAQDWGLTKYRYVHGFHLHHTQKLATEGQGVVSEIWQTPIPQDAWHFGAGFLSGRSVNSVTYHRDYGEVSRCRIAVLDGA
jgi:hypothetical protein